ncbi:MAG: hypothetical protein KF757_10145 [Phycisphaeraceae bacterium]|nr:hypothetical protein [Phycisphaeraceae bacterium]
MTQSPRLAHRLTLHLALCGSCVCFAGCGYDRSLADRLVLGGNTQPIGLATHPANDQAQQSTASLLTMHRGEWATIDVIVPVDGTAHGPLLRIDRRFAFRSPRSKALYPTPDSALDLRESNRRGLVIEGFAQPVLALGQTIALPLVIITEAPSAHASPSSRTLYKRASQGRAILGSQSNPTSRLDSTTPE